MASNKPPARKITGIRGSIPSGYVLGRVSPGEGDTELLSLKKLQSAGLAPSTLPPSGAAGGDLGGNYPNPTVTGLQGRAVSATAPDAGDVLAWSGLAWAPLDLAAVAYSGAWVDLTGKPVFTGGTTGQVLTKVSNTDYDFNWQTPSAGGGGSAYSCFFVDSAGQAWSAMVLSDTNPLTILDPMGVPVYIPYP